MARTRCCGCGRRAFPTDVFKNPKQFGIWLQRWSQIPICQIQSLTNDMKKFKVYYSNSLKKIQMLSLRIQNSQKHLVTFRIKGQEFNSEVNARKKPSTRPMQLNIPVPMPMVNEMPSKRFNFWQVWNKAHVVRIHPFHQYLPGLRSALTKALKTTKKIKILELDGDSSQLDDIFKDLRYVQSLESIYLKQIPLMPLQEYKRALFASHRSLRSITLTGRLEKSSPDDITKFTRVILELPHLKTFNFDAMTSLDFEINHIPFNILKKRDISYNIRVVNHTNQLTLSIPTTVGLENLEFLGINGIEKWHAHRNNRDIFQEQHLEAQEKASKVLFVSLFEMQKVDLSNILRACSNIVTLDISLSISTTIKEISFAGLNNLKNLQNLFLTIDNLEAASMGRIPEPITKCCSADLFKNLAFCAPRLKSVHIYVTGETLPKDEADILDFFKGCSETLTHFTFMNSCYIKIPQKKIKVFYQGLTLLKNLQSLSLMFTPIRDFTTKRIINVESIIKSENLRELHISLASLRQSQITFPKLKYLEKLRLDINQGQINQELFKNLLSFVNLKCLELSTEKPQERIWYKLLVALQKLKNLQILRIKFNYDTPKPPIDQVLEDLKLMKQNHESLHAISLRLISHNRETVWLIGSSYPNQRIEDEKFYWKESADNIKQRIYKVYSI